ncbi:MAG: right-handed parallel beta-helix repeat-containing protein, partial [Candidatus Thorarchaeota archaeon]
MSSRASHLRILLIVAIGILLVISISNNGVTMDSQDHFEHDSLDVNDTDAGPIGRSKLSSSGDVNITTSGTIEDDDSWNSQRGINVSGGADVVFRNCSILLNDGDHDSAWVNVESGSTLVFDNCTLWHYPDDTAFGIRYLDGSDGGIINSKILNFTKLDIGNLASDGFTLHGNEFDDWSALQPIEVQGTAEVNISANEFTNIGDERLYNLIYLIDSPNATIVDNSFHDFGIKERGTAWADWYRGLIDADDGAIIANNTFENLGRVGSGGFYCINANSDNLTIDSNVFSNIRGFGIKIYGTEHLNVTGNLFRNMTGITETSQNEYESSGAILVRITDYYNGTGIIIEHNRIDNVAGAGIFQEKSNNITVRYNTFSYCNGSALRFGDEGSIDYGSFGKTYGNLFFENSIGIFIQNGSDNTFYQNAFINNDLAARDYNHTRNDWNNSAYGNLWFNDYQEEDSNNDWLGDTTPFNYDENITDNHPVFRIGELPPSSGVWEIEIPTVFQWNSISVPADIAVVNSTFGAFGVLNTTVNLANNPTQVTIENNTVAGFLNATFTKGLSIDTYVSTTLQISLIQGDLTFNGHDITQQIEGSTVTGNSIIHHIDDFMMNDNYLNGTTDLQYISNCIADNNTFNDQLLIDDSIDCTFSNASLKGDLGIDGPSNHLTFQDSTFDSLTITSATTANRDVHYITFDNCTFDGVSWALFADCKFITVKKSTFYSGFDATLQAVHNVSVLNNEFYLNGGTAIGIEGDNATVTGNYIVNSTNAIVIGASSNAYTPVVNENEIVNITGNGIDILTEASQVQLSWNRIFNCSGFGIRARHVSNHSIVSKNYVELAGSYGIRINADYGVGVHGYFSNVTHNVVKSCNGNGLEITELYDSMIFNNTLTMNGGFGVVPTRCGDAAFWMNILYENDAGNIDGAGGMHFDNGTLGNFWGPSGPDGNDYYHGYDDGTGNPWIGDVPYEVAPGNYDNYPLLHNQPLFLNEPNTSNDIFAINFRLIVLNTTLFPQKHMYLWENGNLTLVGTTVEFQSDSSTIQYVVVEDGCEFRLIGGATITANNTQATYGFGLRSGARLVMDNASIYRCGYGAGNPGFLVNITTVSFNNLRVGDSSIGMELYQISLNVSNVRFTDCGVGLLVRECSSCNISGLTFSNVDSGLQLNSSSDCTVSMNDFTGCNDYGLSIDDASSSNIIEDNIFGQISGTALYISSSGNE